MLWLFVVAIVMPISMGTCANLTEIEWAQSVNTKDSLTAVLKEKNIRAIDGDVVMGFLKADKDEEFLIETIKKDSKDKGNDKKPEKVPVMSTKPGDTSDLTLEQFLDHVTAYNEKNADYTKAAKLNFKETEAVTKAVELMEDDWEKYMKFGIWLGADIVEGPKSDKKDDAQKMEMVDAKKFFAAIKNLAKPTLALGWTTPETVKADQSYTKENVEAMIKVIDDNKVNDTNPITFPIRAALAINSKDDLKYLHKQVTEKKLQATFTVWSAKGDVVDEKKLEEFIKDMGVENVYVDLPKEMREKLHLNGASTLINFGLFNLVALGFVLFFRTGLH